MALDLSKPANWFKIKSQWKPREESPEELGRRMLRCVDAVTPLHPAFRNWTFLDLFRDSFEMTKENIGEFLCPLEKARSRMTDIVVDWGVGKDDDRTPEPGYGYSMSVTADVPDPSQRVELSAHGGGLVNWTGTPRHASFATDMYHEADPTIVSYPVFKSILMTIISCWDVDYAKVFSRDLVQLRTDSHPVFDVSWMIYLSAPLARRIVVPADVIVKRIPDGGLLMIAAEETFDVANPDHVARARRIVDALEPLNAEEEERLARLNTWRPPRRTK